MDLSIIQHKVATFESSSIKRILLNVCHETVERWRFIARHLYIPEENLKLVESEDVCDEEKYYRLLREWALTRNRRIEKLQSALRETDFYEVADSLPTKLRMYEQEKLEWEEGELIKPEMLLIPPTDLDSTTQAGSVPATNGRRASSGRTVKKEPTYQEVDPSSVLGVVVRAPSPSGAQLLSRQMKLYCSSTSPTFQDEPPVGCDSTTDEVSSRLRKRPDAKPQTQPSRDGKRKGGNMGGQAARRRKVSAQTRLSPFERTELKNLVREALGKVETRAPVSGDKAICDNYWTAVCNFVRGNKTKSPGSLKEPKKDLEVLRKKDVILINREAVELLGAALGGSITLECRVTQQGSCELRDKARKRRYIELSLCIEPIGHWERGYVKTNSLSTVGDAVQKILERSWYQDRTPRTLTDERGERVLFSSPLPEWWRTSPTDEYGYKAVHVTLE